MRLLDYKSGALAIKLRISNAYAGKESSLSRWKFASSNIICHCSSAIDFSSNEYIASTGHKNHLYQQRRYIEDADRNT